MNALAILALSSSAMVSQTFSAMVSQTFQPARQSSPNLSQAFQPALRHAILSQDSQPAAPQAAKPAAPTPPATISGQVDKQISLIEKELVEAAEAMPEEKFNFTPQSLKLKGADYEGVRTFALEIRHVATANYFFWGAITGDKPPEGTKGPNGPDTMTSKADIVKYLRDSFALGHKAAAGLTAQNLNENEKTLRG